MFENYVSRAKVNVMYFTANNIIILLQTIVVVGRINVRVLYSKKNNFVFQI